MTQKTKSIIKRFIRATVSSAVATMLTVIPLSGSWNELKTWLSSLALAGIVGLITGVLQAYDKYFRYK